MENKYYTPTIAEFHVGFECEFKNKMQSNEWEYNVCDTDLISIAFDSHEHEDIDDKFEDTFRVKYLDKEDIESFGFIHEGGKMISSAIQYYKSTENYYIDYTTSNNKLKIHNGESYEQYESFFQGYIKNKSELKKLLTQLEIL